jgi:hypothetical protein
VAVMKAVPAFYDAVKRLSVTQSVSPSFIKFLERVGCKSAGGSVCVHKIVTEKSGLNV